jgi:hypothetical protein
MAGLLALAAANNFVRRLKCMGKLPAIEQWRGRIGPERAAVYNHPQSVWRHFAPLRRVQVAEREDRSTSARQKKIRQLQNNFTSDMAKPCRWRLRMHCSRP